MSIYLSNLGFIWVWSWVITLINKTRVFTNPKNLKKNWFKPQKPWFKHHPKKSRFLWSIYIYLYIFYLYVFLPLYLSIDGSIFLPFYLSTYLSIYLMKYSYLNIFNKNRKNRSAHCSWFFGSLKIYWSRTCFYAYFRLG